MVLNVAQPNSNAGPLPNVFQKVGSVTAAPIARTNRTKQIAERPVLGQITNVPMADAFHIDGVATEKMIAAMDLTRRTALAKNAMQNNSPVDQMASVYRKPGFATDKAIV